MFELTIESLAAQTHTDHILSVINGMANALQMPA
jgi:hypothetical protein